MGSHVRLENRSELGHRVLDAWHGDRVEVDAD